MSNYQYTVWVGGVEVTDYLVTQDTAHDIAFYWKSFSKLCQRELELPLPPSFPSLPPVCFYEFKFKSLLSESKWMRKSS